VELPALNKISSHHSHEHVHGDADHRHEKTGLPHSHSECSHAEILASLVNQTVLFFKEVSSPLINLFTSFKSGSFQELFTVSHSPPLETGPPGHFFSPVPLYLEISVLRI